MSQIGPVPGDVQPHVLGGGGDKNHKKRDYAQTRCAFEPPGRACILVCIREGIVFLPHGCAHPIRVGCCERSPPHLLSRLPFRWLSQLETLPAHIVHRVE